MNDSVQIQDVAYAVITGAGAILSARGCTVVRTGAGNYNLTLNPLALGGPELATNELVASVSLISALSRKAAVVNTSPTVKTIVIADQAGAATDTDFNVSIGRLLGSTVGGVSD